MPSLSTYPAGSFDPGAPAEGGPLEAGRAAHWNRDGAGWTSAGGATVRGAIGSDCSTRGRMLPETV